MKRNILGMSIMSVLLAGQNTALKAAEESDSWYVSPMLSLIKADSDRQADDDMGLMLGIGKQVNDKWNLEVNAVYDNLDFDSLSGEYKQRGLMLDGLYFFDRRTVMQTYGVIGAGVMSTDTGVNDSTNPMLNIGVGIMQQVTDSGMKFRADIRYRMDMDDESITTEDKFNDFMFNVGLTIPFGGKQQSKVMESSSAKQASVVVQQSDSDADGVMDDRDKCSNTLHGVSVDSNGCELAKTVKDDSQTDVVAKDRDSDNDGVVDSVDKCKSTESGVIVDLNGCKLEKSFVLKGVSFLISSDQLTQESKDILNDVVIILNKNKQLKVELAGYTDNRGNPRFNDKLSQLRAESVKAYLVSKGVAAEQMHAKGYGDDNPIDNNETTEGRSNNRRVELNILN